MCEMQAKTFGEGPPMVLLPGGMMGWESWEPFVDHFTGRQRTAVLFQLLNVEYGLTGRELPADYSVKTESRALAATMGSLNYSGPLDVVAWSYGALIALDFALDYPNRIRTLTVIEPPAIWVLRAAGQIDPETRRAVDFFRTLRGDISEDMVVGFLRENGLVKPGQSARDLPGWEHGLLFRQSLRCSPAVALQEDHLDRLRSFRPPVLLIKGTGSAPYLHRIIDILMSNLPNARLLELPGGHAAHIVSRERFLREVEGFQKA